MKHSTLGAYDIADLREMARRRLPKGIFEFMDRGNGDEVALANNRAAFERFKLNPRVPRAKPAFRSRSRPGR